MIKNLEKVRRDGNTVTETMTPDEIMRFFGGPSTIEEIRWESDGKPICLKFPNGVLVRITHGREYLAVLEALDPEWKHSALWVLNEDGTRRFQVPSERVVQGQKYQGSFIGMDLPRSQKSSAFSVTYDENGAPYSFQIDLDAENGEVLGEYLTK